MLCSVKTLQLVPILAIGLLSCEDSELDAAPTAEVARPEVPEAAAAPQDDRAKSANPLSAAGSPAPGERGFEGAVLERLSAGGYTYVAVSDAGVPRWVATLGGAPQTGTQVRVEAFAASTDFHSPRLDRNFDRLLFGTVEPTLSNPDHG